MVVPRLGGGNGIATGSSLAASGSGAPAGGSVAEMRGALSADSASPDCASPDSPPANNAPADTAPSGTTAPCILGAEPSAAPAVAGSGIRSPGSPELTGP